MLGKAIKSLILRNVQIFLFEYVLDHRIIFLRLPFWIENCQSFVVDPQLQWEPTVTKVWQVGGM